MGKDKKARVRRKRGSGPTQFDESRRQAVERHPYVVSEIDRLVTEIATLVSKLPPLKLLFRARMTWLSQFEPKTEAEINPDDVLAMRLIDYVQSMIAAVPPSNGQSEELADEDWDELKEKIEKLFQLVRFDYQFSSEHSGDDPRLVQLKSELQVYWCDVRGKRYEAQIPSYLQDMFLPHDEVLKELFGLSGEQFVEAFLKIWTALIFDGPHRVDDFDQLKKDVEDALRRKRSICPHLSGIEDRQLRAEIIRDNGWEQRWHNAFERLQNDLYDVEKISNLPRELLDDLAWSPGEDREFLAEGQFRGWPLRRWPIFKRPFMRLDGRYYCFELSSLFDNLYRVMHRVVLSRKPKYQETWNNIQKNLSESLIHKS